MQSLRVLNLLQYETAQEFFIDVIAASADDENFSQRGVSQSLDWLVSCLPDLVKSKASCCCTRAKVAKLLEQRGLDGDEVSEMIDELIHRKKVLEENSFFVCL